MRDGESRPETRSWKRPMEELLCARTSSGLIVWRGGFSRSDAPLSYAVPMSCATPCAKSRPRRWRWLKREYRRDAGVASHLNGRPRPALGPEPPLRSECDPYSHPVEEEVALVAEGATAVGRHP